MSYKIRNWKKFQHFKDRKPPWIKLYRDILDDIAWHNLSGEAAKALTMLWLIASESDGYLPDIKTISFRLRIPEEKTKTLISQLNQWIDYDDIKTISSGYQNDSLETETETETDENEKITSIEKLKSHSLNGKIEKFFKEKYPHLDRFKIRDSVIDYCEAKNKKYSDYYAAMRNFARNDKTPKPKTNGRTLDELKKTMMMGVENA